MSKENSGIHSPTPKSPHLFVRPKSTECILIARGDSNLHGCPLHRNCSCSHGLDSYVCEYGITQQ